MLNRHVGEFLFDADKVFVGLARQALFELRLAYRFIRGDLWTTLYPGVAVTAAALGTCSLISVPGLARLIIAAAQISLLFYGVALSEQWRAGAEDRLNKPWRPLAAGAITLTQLKIRCFVVWSMILALTSSLGTERWALSVLSISILHGHLGLARHWWAKSLLPPVAMLSMVGAQWQVAAPLTSELCRWGLWMFVMIVATIAVQDLRDVEGDRAVQRRTLPIVMGDRAARMLLTTLFVLLPLPEFFLLRRAHASSLQMAACFALLTAFSLLLAWRVQFRRGPAEDQLTYRIWEYWFTAMLVCMGLCNPSACIRG